MTTTKKTKHLRRSRLTDEGEWQIRFHSGIGHLHWACAEETGQHPGHLLHAVEEGVRTRHSEARIAHPADKGNDLRPDVYTLELETVKVFFSYEAAEILIRGLGWDIDREPLNDFDGGGFYCN